MDTAQNTPATQLQAPQRAKQRRSHKSPELKQAVLAKAFMGANNSQIAKDLRIDRSTVKAILTATEIQQFVEEGRANVVRMIPKGVEVIANRLEKGSETAAIAVLRGTRVLDSSPAVQQVNNIQANTWIQLRQETIPSLSVPAKGESKPEITLSHLSSTQAG